MTHLRFSAAVASAAVMLVALAGSAGAADQNGVTAPNAVRIVDDMSIPKSLTGTPGDPANGREVAINRKKGNCLACHQMPIPEQPYHGEAAPDLAGVGDRYEEGELRLRLVDSKVLNPDTMMPAFYRDSGFNRVAKNFVGKTILTAQEVEDVIAYLMTLK